MDIDNLQQNMNTRVVFKEPRGMARWLQLFFAIIAFSTVVDFYTSVGIDITCPTTPPAPTPAPTPNGTQPVPPAPPAPIQAPVYSNTSLIVTYPFDFKQQQVNNTCPGHSYTYTHLSPLSGSPQFFVMTGVLSLLYAATSLVVYLLFSSTYDSIPVVPVADLIVTAVLCLFWFIGASSFSSGVSLLKSTITYDAIKQVLCPPQFLQMPGVVCAPSVVAVPSWKALNVGLVSGFTSFFLWGAGLWFVYKETHFHTPRDQFGPR